MSPAALREHLSSLGVRLMVRGDKLVCDAPLGVLTEEVRADVAACRDILVAHVRCSQAWGESAIQEAIAASLDRVSAASHGGALMGADEVLASAMDDVNAAYQRRDIEKTLAALWTFEAYALQCYASASRVP